MANIKLPVITATLSANIRALATTPVGNFAGSTSGGGTSASEITKSADEYIGPAMEVFVKAEGAESLPYTFQAGDRVQTSGYYADGDGGGAHYTIQTLDIPEDCMWAFDLGDDLYAVIDETVVNYRMFGAKLDGVTDDYEALRNTHLYQMSRYTLEPESERKHYYVSVENHEGIIHKGNDLSINCCGNIDLSGSKILYKDQNATWFGFYLWGDNESSNMTFEPSAEARKTYKKDNFVIDPSGLGDNLKDNAVLFLKEDPYAVRDDAGYLYSEPRYELLLHAQNGLLASPFQEDWDTAGGLEIAAPLTNTSTGEVSSQSMVTQFSCQFNMLPNTHYYFTGCEVMFETSADKYCTVLWCKCHNAHISGFNIRPNAAQLHNTRFKNAMIYIWGSYNVEVSNIVGFNAAGKKSGSANGTSGYVIRATNCLQLNIHDVSVQGYWGATAMNCVKEVHLTRVSINRIDIHNYFYNMYIDQCVLFNHGIQIGDGRGLCQITNSSFFINDIPEDSYPNAHIVELNTTYGRVFEGRIFIQNCNVVMKSTSLTEFDVIKCDFSPEAVSSLDHYKFPEITIRDCTLMSYQPDTYLVYVMIAGKRNCKSATKAPTVAVGYCSDSGNDNNGTLRWKSIGRGADWRSEYNGVNMAKGQILRVYDSYKDKEGFTVFHNIRYYEVITPGALPAMSNDNKPTATEGELTIGSCRVKAVTDAHWEANRAYALGDYCFTEDSYWLPVSCYECVSAGTSNGYRPVHLTGQVIDGLDTYPQNLDACWWEHVKAFTDYKTFKPKMTVKQDDILYDHGRLFKVLKEGTLLDVPPERTPWEGWFTEGTAHLAFIGKDWEPQGWFALDSFCISTATDGKKHMYQLKRHAGITSGNRPVPGNARVVDGDIIWACTDEAASGQWQARTAYSEGAVVSNQGNNYKCVFNGVLEMPRQLVIENVSTNMIGGGEVFAFWSGGTDLPAKINNQGSWSIKVDNAEHYRFVDYNGKYFGHAGNPNPKITIGGQLSADGMASLDDRIREIAYADEKVYMSKTVSGAGTSVYLAGNTYTIPNQATKLRITGQYTVDSASVGIRSTGSSSNVTVLRKMSTPQSAVFNVKPGSQITPTFSMWSGTADGVLTLTLECSDKINEMEATLTLT